ncbi:hypothetical protein V6N13_122546 [Hibiscus sabdariffa]
MKPPLGDSGCDMLGWKWSKTRQFSVRSVYAIGAEQMVGGRKRELDRSFLQDLTLNSLRFPSHFLSRQTDNVDTLLVM